VDAITWKPAQRQWPGNVDFLRDPGDIASIDYGIRSRRPTLVMSSRWARFTCAHARVTVDVDIEGRSPLSRQSLTLLVLWLAYQGNTCPCFRAKWWRIDPRGKFCRAAAIETWRQIVSPLGIDHISPTWEERVGGPAEDEEYRDWGGEIVYDGLFLDLKGGAPRLPRRR
jgi:hypothetical protein